MENISIAKRRDWKVIVLFAVFFILFFFIEYNVPAQTGDWAFKAADPFAKAGEMWTKQNGQLFAHILTALMISVHILTPILCAGLLSLLLFVCSKASTENKPDLITFLIMASAIILIPRELFKETYTSVSGFANIVPPVIPLVAYIYLTRNIFSKEKPAYKSKMALAGLGLGLATQLFAEHISLFVLIFGIAVIVYCAARFEKIYAFHFLFVLGVCIGAAIMLLSPGYWSGGLETGNDVLVTDFLSRVAGAYLNGWSKWLVMDHVLINAGFAYVFCRLAAIRYSSEGNGGFRISNIPTLCRIGLAVMLLTPLIGLIHNYIPAGIFIYIGAVLTPLFILSIIMLTVKMVKKSDVRLFCLFLFIGACASVFPLLFIKSMEQRDFFMAYILMAIAFVRLLEYSKASNRRNYNIVVGVIGLCSALLMIYFCFMFGFIGYSQGLLQKDIKVINETSSQKLTVMTPNGNWLLKSMVPDITEVDAYRQYYGIGDDVEISFLDKN